MAATPKPKRKLSKSFATGVRKMHDKAEKEGTMSSPPGKHHKVERKEHEKSIRKMKSR